MNYSTFIQGLLYVIIGVLGIYNFQNDLILMSVCSLVSLFGIFTAIWDFVNSPSNLNKIEFKSKDD